MTAFDRTDLSNTMPMLLPDFDGSNMSELAAALGCDPADDPDLFDDSSWADALLAQWDDDPNPYHGDYSEM
jgi:hypothetical protein